MIGESGISTLAALQVLATIPNLTDGHQVMHELFVADVLVEGLIDMEGGTTAVPDRPRPSVSRSTGITSPALRGCSSRSASTRCEAAVKYARQQRGRDATNFPLAGDGVVPEAARFPTGQHPAPPRQPGGTPAR